MGGCTYYYFTDLQTPLCVLREQPLRYSVV